MDIFHPELSQSHMSYVFKIILLTILFSGCASNQFITDKNEFKKKVFSKTIEVDTNYQKLAHCIDAKWSMFNYRSPERNVERVTISGLVSR